MKALNSDNCRILPMLGKEKSLANLNRGGRLPGAKNKINRSMQDTIRNVWEEMQDDPETSLLAMAKKNPQWFYELCKGMFPKDLFIDADINLNQMSPEELDNDIARLMSECGYTLVKKDTI
jgi:hypothetical protein